MYKKGEAMSLDIRALQQTRNQHLNEIYHQHAIYWLAKLFCVGDREGWEEGETEEEIRASVLKVLDNAHIGPYIYPTSLANFLEATEERVRHSRSLLMDVGNIGDWREALQRNEE